MPVVGAQAILRAALDPFVLGGQAFGISKRRHVGAQVLPELAVLLQALGIQLLEIVAFVEVGDEFAEVIANL